MSHALLQELKYPKITEYFWTDSKVLLGYINNDARRFHVFVSNRVQQIRDHTSPEQWHYIASQDNPADDASRGLSALRLTNDCRWLKGPDFLWNPEMETAAENDFEENLASDDPEIKRSVTLATTSSKYSTMLERFQYFSDWHRLKCAVAVCVRYRDILRKRISDTEPRHRLELLPIDVWRKEKLPLYETTTVQEMNQAEKYIISQLQHKVFSMELNAISQCDLRLDKQSCLYRLNPLISKDDSNFSLLRVGGRIKHSPDPFEVKHPIIIPKNTHVTTLIVKFFHERVEHQGKGFTLNEIRANGLWIVNGPAEVRRYISQCIKCKKLRGRACLQQMSDLPPDRLEPTPPFTYSAVDYFGPWYVKHGRKQIKRYGVLFTCLVSRAVHLEVASSLDTDSYLNALRRFLCRRGPVRSIRSDQGTNFVGAKRELQRALDELDKSQVKDQLKRVNCDWFIMNMNVPHASHMGGVWERQIRTARSIMNALLDKNGQSLTDESLTTFFCEVEALINSRPLSAETLTDHGSPVPLTPNHLLTQKSRVLLPPPGQFKQHDMYLRKQWRRVQHLANAFWDQWRKSYLIELQQRTKWVQRQPNFQLDDLCLVMDENTPRNVWKLGKVQCVNTSADGLVRSVKVLLADEHLDSAGKRVKVPTVVERPIHKLIALKLLG